MIDRQHLGILRVGLFGIFFLLYDDQREVWKIIWKWRLLATFYRNLNHNLVETWMIWPLLIRILNKRWWIHWCTVQVEIVLAVSSLSQLSTTWNCCQSYWQLVITVSCQLIVTVSQAVDNFELLSKLSSACNSCKSCQHLETAAKAVDSFYKCQSCLQLVRAVKAVDNV